MTTETHDHGSNDHKPTRSAPSSEQSLLARLLPERLRSGTAAGHLLVKTGMAVAVVLAAVLAGTGGAVAAPVNPGDGGDEYPGSLQGDDSQTVPEILSDDIQAEIVDTSEESITVELRFPTDTFAGEEQFPQDTFTGEQILTDQQLDTSAAPTQVAGREGMVTPNPAPGGAGETATATTAEVEKITEDDGISYFLTVRTADLDLSVTPDEELTGTMLMYPPETSPEFTLDDLADSPGEPSISPRTDQDPNRLIVNPNASPGEPSDLATAQSNPAYQYVVMDFDNPNELTMLIPVEREVDAQNP